MKKIILGVCALVFLFLPQGEACTGLRLTSKDGSIVHGRTLEFGIEMPATTAVIPRGFAFTGTSPLGEGLAYEAKYGFVGVFLFDKMAVLDGINEKGLSIGTFFFPGFAEYAAITQENQKKALSPSEFPNWVLSQFASVGEVKAALSSIVIAPTVEQGWGTAPAPFHYIVYDQAGHCLVIEPLKGKLRTYNNKLGVFSNSPTFEWHITNLRNYINLKPDNVLPVDCGTLLLAPFGQGSGMVGLPGDFTPPSRFVRAAIISQCAIPSDTADEAVFQTFHLLNLFDIPKGISREIQNGKTIGIDSTSLTCVRDPQGLKYYYKTYEDQAIKMVDLKKFDLNAKTIKKLPIQGSQPVIDVSEQLTSL